MRLHVALLAVFLLVACADDDPSSPGGSVQPTAVQSFQVTPARDPGATIDVVVTFPLAIDVAVTRTDLVVAGTEDELLPSPWAGLYKINGQILFEGRSQQDAGTWRLKIQFRNDSQIVCSSCDPVSVEYRIWATDPTR